jgi:CHAT domain-containing protein/tetratricopeptide (TPR) repeat protein
VKKAWFVFLLFPVLAFGQVDTAAVRAEADSLLEMVDEVISSRDLDQALNLLNQVEEKILPALGKENEFYAQYLNKRGMILYYQANFSEAIYFWHEALKIRGEVLGKEHKDYAASLTNLGVLYRAMGDYEKAEPLSLEASIIREKVFGNTHPDYAGSLINLGSLYLKMGNYEKAELFYMKGKQIFEESLDMKEHPYYLNCLNNLGGVYVEMGDYERGELLLFEVLKIRKKMLGEEHPIYASSLLNLGLVYEIMGNYEKAKNLYLEALDIEEKYIGKIHPDYAQTLNRLGNVFGYLSDYTKSEALYLEALDLQEKFTGKEHPYYAGVLINLGILYNEIGNYEKAEAFYLEALDIQQKSIGKIHPDYAQTLFNLGDLYSNVNYYEKAETFYQESSEVLEKVVGKQHPTYANNLNKQGVLYWKMGNLERVEPFLLESSKINKTLLILASRFLSESELSIYAQKYTKQQDQYITIAQDQGKFSTTSFDNALFYKGFLLNVSKGLNRLTQSDLVSRELFQEYKSYLCRLSQEYAKPITERQNVAELEEKANALEKELVRTVAGYGDAIRQVEWEEVRDELQPGEAAIEFVHYNCYTPDPTDSIMYAALVLRPDDEVPHFIPLFEEKQLTSLLLEEYDEQKDYLNELYGSENHQLYQLIWQPLDSLLNGVKTIYASPSGLLHRFNLGAVMMNDQQTVADQYEVNILGSTRQLVVKGEQAENRDLSALVYGGIQYEMDSTAIVAAIAGVADSIDAYDSQLSFSYLERGTPERGRSWDYLPATKKEVETIAEKIKAQNGSVKVYEGYQATEESLKGGWASADPKEKSPKILHLATHGYFYPDPEEKKEVLLSSEAPAFKISDHPMIRSGLIMAGGNHVWKGNAPIAGLEDGILTAYEVSQLDLSNTELVVLSACETGLGDIEGNEGVYGLQRAFKIAGAKNLIMSLWSVPDQQTQEMMTLFYDKWLSEGMELEGAFRAAQQEMRRKYEDHYYWAGFVLIQ